MFRHLSSLNLSPRGYRWKGRNIEGVFAKLRILLDLPFTTDEDQEKTVAKISGNETLQPRPCYKAQAAECRIELFIHKFTNEFRVENGLEPLGFHKNIGYVSRRWSEQLTEDGELSHRGFPEARIDAYKKEFTKLDVGINGENVAYIGGRNITERDAARLIVDLWIESEGHRKNLLGDFEIEGVGVFISTSAIYATQIFGEK